MPTEAVEICLNTPAGKIAGLHWPAPGKPRVLALHGWLDNAASFIPMAPLLSDVDLVALDLPGHGRSDWRPEGSWYHFIDYVGDALRAAEALNWPSFHLLGHSLGARACSALAAACPQKVLSLSLIEGVGPACVRPTEVVATLRRAVEGLTALSGKQRRVFDDIALAIRARQQNGRLEPEAARLLVERGVEPSGSGWRWRSDPRLTLASPMRLVEVQAMALLEAVEAPTLVISADPLDQLEDQVTLERRMAAIGRVEQRSLPGGHHLHMETPEPVAAAVRRHILAIAADTEEKT